MADRTVFQIGRFGLVGVGLNVALYLLYLVLTALGLTPIMASTLAFLVGLPISLTAHRRITFRADTISTARKVGFVALYLFAYVTLIGTLAVLHHGMGVPHPVAQAVAIGVSAILNFIVQKLFIFRA